jgi:hypothetical protein
MCTRRPATVVGRFFLPTVRVWFRVSDLSLSFRTLAELSVKAADNSPKSPDFEAVESASLVNSSS